MIREAEAVVAEPGDSFAAGPDEHANREACPNFDRLAGIYRWMELATFGPLLQMCRCAFLHRLTGCRRALVLGDGDGRFTARLLRAAGSIAIVAVDASPAMLRGLVRRAGPHAGRVEARVADARRWTPAGNAYDLVVTHFFLDCLATDEVRRLAEIVAGAVEDGALWVVSEFAIPRSRLGRWMARPLVAGLYWAFGLLTGLRVRRLPDHGSALGEAGFRLERRRARLGGLLVSELWRAGRTSGADPKATGVA